MKRLVLPLVAFLLSASFATAQTLKTLGTVRAEKNPNVGLIAPAKTPKAAPKKADATAHQYYLGNITDADDITDDNAPQNSVGLPGYAGKVTSAACMIDPDKLALYDGGKIVGMRFALGASVGTSRVFVMGMTSDGNITDDIVSQDVPFTSSGWNEVELDEPHTIDLKKEGVVTYLIGYDYTQKSGQTQAAYPLTVGTPGYAYSLLLYGSLGNGTGWYTMDANGTNYGLACQLLIETEGEVKAVDLSLTQLVTVPFVKKGEKLQVSGYAKSALEDLTNVNFGASMNGKEFATFNSGEMTFTDKYQNFGIELDAPDNMKGVGEKNELAVYVKDINGVVPTGDKCNDDTIKANVAIYSESVARQKELVEHFTSQYCTYCPYGYDVLNKLTTDRNDIAWVSIHGDMSTGSDVYTTDDSQYITALLTQGYPSAALNRYYYPGMASMLSYSLGYADAETGAKNFDQLLQISDLFYPAFANINLDTKYDAATRKLTVKVSGNTVADFEKLMRNGAALTIYLTEDGLVSKQLNGQEWIEKYNHNNVLRKVVTSQFGDEVIVNNGTYELDYDNIVLDKSWNADNMNVIAFISCPLTYTTETYQGSKYQVLDKDYTEYWVTNAEKVKLGQSASGIAGNVVVDHNNGEVARYTIDGQKVSAPVKGINLVKMANGKTVKVIVK